MRRPDHSKKNLEDQKRAIVAELKAKYHLTPARIPYQLREYNHAIREMERKLNSTGQQEKNSYKDF